MRKRRERKTENHQGRTFLSEYHYTKYPWLKYSFNHKHTNKSINKLIEHLGYTNEELSDIIHYIKIADQSWIKEYLPTEVDANGSGEDLQEFNNIFKLEKGKDCTKHQLYGLYLLWSKNPISKEHFISVYNGRYALPKEDIIIDQLLLTFKNRRKRRVEQQLKVKKLIYGIQKKFSRKKENPARDIWSLSKKDT